MKKKSVFIILGTLFGFNILAWVGVFQLNQSYLEVTFFDVGQGDAIFIETPEGHQILIDGGQDEIVLERLGDEMPFWDRTIDLVILTHPEHDHYGGLIEVLKRYDVENILWTGVLRNTAEYKEWRKLIQEECANIYIAKAGQRIYGSPTSVRRSDFRILYPFESIENKEVSSVNNTSIIAKLSYGETSFLFTGDAFKKVERELVKRGTDIDSDVLKIGHHGSKTSSAEEFIELVSPGTAVISVGKDNKYGHPHQETLKSLNKIRILRTDLDGNIKIISDGTVYKIKNPE